MAFQKGISGNPNGRPKKNNTFSEILEIALAKRKITLEESKKTIQGKEILAEILLDIATDKQAPYKIRMDAISMIIDRTDGKPLQTVTGELINNSRVLEAMTTEERIAEFERIMA